MPDSSVLIVILINFFLLLHHSFRLFDGFVEFLKLFLNILLGWTRFGFLLAGLFGDRFRMGRARGGYRGELMIMEVVSLLGEARYQRGSHKWLFRIKYNNIIEEDVLLEVFQKY